jgi:hypothetical protein
MVATGELRASFLATKQDLYELDIDLLMQAYRQDRNQETLVKAFSMSEQRRARSLLDSLGEAKASIRRVVSPELRHVNANCERNWIRRQKKQIKLLSGSHTPDQALALGKEVESVSTDYEQVSAQIIASDPRYAALTQSPPLGLKDIQKEIDDPDTCYSNTLLVTNEVILWAVTATDIGAYELPGRSEIESQTLNVYGLLTARSRFVKFENPKSGGPGSQTLTSTICKLPVV